MIRKFFIGILLTFQIIGGGCTGRLLHIDASYRKIIDNHFEDRFKRFSEVNDTLFNVFNLKMTEDELLSMKFLYSFMPLSDLADYSGEYFLSNTRLALRSLSEMPWGGNTRGEMFLHFILPVRVNNENLDNFRINYYEEIASRIRGIDNIEGAALEINHWCHEKVAYQPSDMRTSAPESTILSARGRCGEESTFTVAALRSAGIPARQVYTPRWAHSDDNHAWVEIWNGKEWKYMGACEPEHELDRGWFTEPARRAMLINTKTFGHYSGDEKVTYSKDLFSEINNLHKYAETKDLTVKVLDESGMPATGASVEFQLFNYAEFYPLASLEVDSSGCATFTTGFGDLLIWARRDDYFGFTEATIATIDTITISLSEGRDIANHYDLDLYAPPVKDPYASIDKSLSEKNTLRLKKEDSIRISYIKSWDISSDRQKLDDIYGEEMVSRILGNSMGNYSEIRKFLNLAADVDSQKTLGLLSGISDKDLRDTKESVLMDHLLNTSSDRMAYPSEIYLSAVLSPRIANEILTPWRSFLQSYFRNDSAAFAGDPASIVQWIMDNIRLNTIDNYYSVPISPMGVIKVKEADELSRKILFTAICRSLGVASRLDPATRVAQYYESGSWKDVYFSDKLNAESEKSFLRFDSGSEKPEPAYQINFTIAKFDNGRYNTLEYDYGRVASSFSDYMKIDAGRYMLVTGNRIGDTKVLATIDFFTLKPGEHKTVKIKLRHEVSGRLVLSTVNINELSKNIAEISGKDLDVENGTVLAWIKPGSEPTRHIFNDIPPYKETFDQLGTNFVFLQMPGEAKGNDDMDVPGMPSNTQFITDTESMIIRMVTGEVSPELANPFIVYIDNNGNVLFRSEGYRIGIGEQILRCIK